MQLFSSALILSTWGKRWDSLYWYSAGNFWNVFLLRSDRRLTWPTMESWDSRSTTPSWACCTAAAADSFLLPVAFLRTFDNEKPGIDCNTLFIDVNSVRDPPLLDVLLLYLITISEMQMNTAYKNWRSVHILGEKVSLRLKKLLRRKKSLWRKIFAANNDRQKMFSSQFWVLKKFPLCRNLQSRWAEPVALSIEKWIALNPTTLRRPLQE